MINVVDASSLSNFSASPPISILSNSGKSIPSCNRIERTLKYNTLTVVKRSIAERN